MASVTRKRKIKCNATGEEGYNVDFYKAPDGKYYKTKEIYKEYVFQESCHRECRDMLMNLFNYKYPSTFCENTNGKDGKRYSPALLFKELNRIHSKENWEVILHTTKSNREQIKYSLKNKFFPSEYSKIRYIIAIIENSLKDAKRDLAWIKKARELKKVREERLVETIVANDINVDIGTDEVTRKVKDISKFL